MSSRNFISTVDNQDALLSNAFSRNVTIEEPDDSYIDSELLSSNTLKRQPRIELERNELLKMLTYLEGKLQASDICIASLKSERVKSLLFQAKHGKHGLNDPVSALARDHAKAIMVSTAELRGELCNNLDEGENQQSQLAALDNLITAISEANHVSNTYRNDLQIRLDKTNKDLEDCIQQQRVDNLQADNVTFMLEKEKERLIEKFNIEKSRADVAEKNVILIRDSSEQSSLEAKKHKEIALALLAERRSMHESIAQLQVVRQAAKTIIKDEKSKSCKALELNEAYISEIKILKLRLEEEKIQYQELDTRNKTLQTECSQLKTRVDLLQRSAGAAAHISRVLAPATITRNATPRLVAPPVPPNKPIVYKTRNNIHPSPIARSFPTASNVLQRPGVPLITSTTNQHADTKTLLHR